MAAMAVIVMVDCTRLPARTPKQLMAVSKANAAAAMKESLKGQCVSSRK